MDAKKLSVAILPRVFLFERNNQKMKLFLKYLFFLIGGVICVTLLVFSIYTDLAHLSGYTPSPLEK
ncbi:hypothetical protein C1N87_26560 (plasmid) [Priestia aryabhattai]